MNTEILELIREKALSLGFSMLGFANAKISPKEIKHYESWLENNLHAELSYMENVSPRKNTEEILVNAKAIITLATNYNIHQKPLKKDSLRIARYAHGRDYHKFIKKRLIALEKFLKTIIPEINTRSFVDACPLLERAFAKESGLGFIGKNSCLITKDFGSFVFLSEIICDIDLSSSCKSRKHIKNDFSTCGSCTLCMDSCPTKAIIKPGVIDANRCIAYQTIENKEEIPEELKPAIKSSKYLFGCDICQSVCPHNSFKPETKDPEILKPIAGDQHKISDLEKLKNEEAFLEKFKGSPLMRAKLKGVSRIIKLHKTKE